MAPARPELEETLRQYVLARNTDSAEYQRIVEDYLGPTQMASITAHVRAGTREMVAQLNDIKGQREWVNRPDWMPRRPRRSVPTLWKLAEYWATRDVFEVHSADPHCFACQRSFDYDEAVSHRAKWNALNRYLERAHLFDRWRGGLDGPQNVVPLCRVCHRLMPEFFHEGDHVEAILWVQQGGWRSTMAEL
jgi:hypothetical protein